MEKDKIAFVVVRYGKDINGGAEYHCRMLAERLTKDYDVEVLTTCVKDYGKGGNEYVEGGEDVNGVKVRRFMVDPIPDGPEWKYLQKAKPVRRLRMFLFRIGCLRLFSYFMPVWSYKRQEELESLKRCVFYSTHLHRFIEKNKASYKAFVAFTIDYTPFYYTAILAGEKTIAIPTMHYTKHSFRGILTEAFSKLAYVGFNTSAELNLGKRVFGKAMKKCGVISVGVEEPQAASWDLTQKKYNLPTDYLLYVGRVDPDKIGSVFQYFIAYKKKFPLSVLKLVLVGGLNFEHKPFQHPDVVYTGFVSDEEKMVILQHAKVTINPSKYESLSLILLEALNQERMMLVNGHCKVLKGHCKQSGYAADYYMNEKQFISKLHRIVSSEELRKQKGVLGKQYVMANYNWEVIMTRLKQVIESAAL